MKKTVGRRSEEEVRTDYPIADLVNGAPWTLLEQDAQNKEMNPGDR